MLGRRDAVGLVLSVVLLLPASARAATSSTGWAEGLWPRCCAMPRLGRTQPWAFASWRPCRQSCVTRVPRC